MKRICIGLTLALFAAPVLSQGDDFSLPGLTQALMWHLGPERRGDDGTKMEDYPAIPGTTADAARAAQAAGYGDASDPSRLLIVLGNRRVCDMQLSEISWSDLTADMIGSIASPLKSALTGRCRGLVHRDSSNALHIFATTEEGLNGPKGVWVSNVGTAPIELFVPSVADSDLVFALLEHLKTPKPLITLKNGRGAYVDDAGAVRLFMQRPDDSIIDRSVCPTAADHPLYNPTHRLIDRSFDPQRGSLRDVALHVTLRPPGPDLFAYVACQ